MGSVSPQREDNGYEPLKNGEQTIAAIIDMLVEVDRRRYDCHMETLSRIDKLDKSAQGRFEDIEVKCVEMHDEFDQKMADCRAEEHERTKQAVEFAAHELLEDEVKGKMSARVKTVLWSFGIISGVVISIIGLLYG